MRRAPTPAPDIATSPPHRLGARLVLAFVLLVATPFAIDLFNVMRVNWDLMCGVPYPYTSTPALDWAGDVIDAARRSAWMLAGRRLHDGPWKPIPTILFALGWAFVAGLLLRGTMRR